MKITVKKLSDLRESEKNVRKHTDKQIKEYIRSLEMFGQIKPVVVDETGEIIAGNGLFKALVEMGKDTCDCYVVSGLTPAQKKKLMLADNRVYELGITDVSVFEEIILDLDGDIDVPGWDEDLLSMMNASVPDVDDMVSNYGAFEEEEVDKLADRKPAVTTAAPEEQPAAYSPTPVAAPSETTVQDMPTAQEKRFIVCPKCGERICL